jgi:hypothetical protein
VPARRSLSVTQAATRDIERLSKDAVGLDVRARALIELVEEGRVTGQELTLMPSYGDLSDCRKIYFGLHKDDATHRLVYQVVQDGGVATLEVVAVVAVENRDEGYVYLLASNRLGRLPDETRPKLNRVHQQHIAKRGRKTPRSG